MQLEQREPRDASTVCASLHMCGCVCEGGELGGVPYPRVDQERHRKEPKVKDSH